MYSRKRGNFAQIVRMNTQYSQCSYLFNVQSPYLFNVQGPYLLNDQSPYLFNVQGPYFCLFELRRPGEKKKIFKLKMLGSTIHGT